MPFESPYRNVDDRFVPENLPDLTFAHSEVDYVHNTDELNVAYELLDQGIEENGWDDQTAYVNDETGKTITYAELQTAVDEMVGGLEAAGIEPGDRVLWRFEVCVEAVITQLATWKIGAITVPSVVQERARELRYYLEDTEATAIITSATEFEEVEKVLKETSTVETVIVDGTPDSDFDYHVFDEVRRSADPIKTPHPNHPLDVASILYTGGTTGRSKGCIHSHAEALAAADIQVVTEQAATQDDVYFCPAPMGHAFGNDERLFPLRVGATVVLKDHPSPPEMVDIVEDYDVTVFAIVGAIMNMLMNNIELEDRDFSSVRLFRCPGQGTTEEGFKRWTDLTGVKPLNEFGMTPIHGFIVSSYTEGEPFAPRYSMGKPYSGYEVKLVDIDSPDDPVGRGEPGRPAVRGPTGIAYWQNRHPDMPHRQEEDVHEGWSLIDDVWEKHDDGNFWYLSRIDNMISTGGRQVAPGEIEEVLSGHENVSDVAVVGKPDYERGEIVKAYVVTVSPIEDEAAFVEEVQSFAKDNMAPYKYPRDIEVMETLPVDDVGKIQYTDLEEQAAAEAEEQGTAP